MRFKEFLTGVILTFLIHTTVSAGQKETINEMLDTFLPGCSLSGESVRNTIGIVKGLQNVLTQMAQDEDCQGLSATVSDLSWVEEQVNEFSEKYDESQLEVFGLKQRKKEVLSLLLKSKDPVERSVLQDELRFTQVELAHAEGSSRGRQKNRRQESLMYAANSLVNSSTSIINQIANQSRCWEKNPSVLGQAAAFGASISQSLSLGLLTGGISTIVGGGLQLVASVMSSVERIKKEKPIKDMANNMNPLVFNCAMEKMSSQICESQERIETIEMFAKSLNSNAEDDVWFGMQLVQRELDVAANWLQLIYAGADPDSAAAAQQRQEIYRKEEALKSSRDLIIGEIESTRNLFDSAGQLADPNERKLAQWKLELRVFDFITKQFFGSGVKNPLADYHGVSEFPYVLLGVPKNDYPTNRDGEVRSVFDFDPTQIGTPQWPFESYRYENPSLSRLRSNFLVWYEKANAIFQTEKNFVVNKQPEQSFITARVISFRGKTKGLSPLLAIERISKFFQKYPPSQLSDFNLQQFYTDTIERLNGIHQTIIDVTENQMDPNDGIQKITELAKFESSQTFLADRITFLLRIIIEDIATDPEKSNPDESLILLASEDVIQLLKESSGVSNWQVLLDSELAAQALGIKTINSFYDTFGKRIHKTLFQINEDYQRSKGDQSSRPFLSGLTMFCFNMLSIQGVDSKKISKVCSGLQRKSLFENGPKSPVWKKDLLQTPYFKRACIERNFKKRSFVYQALLENGDRPDWSMPPLFTKIKAPPPKRRGSASNEMGLCENAVKWRGKGGKICYEDWHQGCDRKKFAKICKPITLRKH